MIIQSIFLAISSTMVILYLIVFLLSDYGKKAKAVPSTGHLTVLVPTYNEADNIGECLDSLLRMDDPGASHSIQVIDDNSPDGTAEIVSKYAPRVSLIRRASRSSKADALNHAVQNLKGDVFAVVDADCVVGKQWLGKLVIPFSDDSVGISTGSILVKNRNDTIWTRLQSCELAFLCHQLMKPVERVGMLLSINGNNFAFTRSCWEKVKGFDPTKLTEDTDFAIKTRLSGLQIRFADAKVLTHVPTSLGDLLRQRRRWYLGWYQDSSPGLLAGAIFILLFYYAIIFFLLSFSPLSILLFLLYYAELSTTFRGAYGKVDLVNPLVFIIFSPVVTTATLITALPSALKGKRSLTFDEHW